MMSLLNGRRIFFGASLAVVTAAFFSAPRPELRKVEVVQKAYAGTCDDCVCEWHSQAGKTNLLVNTGDISGNDSGGRCKSRCADGNRADVAAGIVNRTDMDLCNASNVNKTGINDFIVRMDVRGCDSNADGDVVRGDHPWARKVDCRTQQGGGSLSTYSGTVPVQNGCGPGKVFYNNQCVSAATATCLGSGRTIQRTGTGKLVCSDAQ